MDIAVYTRDPQKTDYKSRVVPTIVRSFDDFTIKISRRTEHGELMFTISWCNLFLKSAKYTLLERIQ